MNPDRTLPWDWHPGRVPENVALHEQAYLETTYSFQLCRSGLPDAVRIGAGSSLYLGVMFDLGENARVRIGNYVLIHGARIICDEEITIGDYCLISWNVVLMDSRRVPLDPAGRRPALEQAAGTSPRRAPGPAPAHPIRVGPNVWLGFESCVLPGIEIGEGSIIGARSVVADNVPPFSVAVGNPARVIRRLEPGERETPGGASETMRFP